MNESQTIESKTTQSICAQCGSALSSFDEPENFCVTCLLRIALGDEDVECPARPHRFDQYELIIGANGAPVELGRGAMGVTYKALDTNLRCEVALKVIQPRYLADEPSLARFLSEARAAAQLRHRNIASVFHLGNRNGEYFYAMELVEGETIEERIRRKGPIDCPAALDIALQITCALIATGSRQFVHRDVKSSNVMLCTEADGAIVAKLIDFGLVRTITDQSPGGNPSVARGGFIGTPHYASPEQFAGVTTDARSDVFSLGVTLWFMLTGTLPFTGTREEIRQQQLGSTLPLDQLQGVPRTVVDLIKHMLESDPAKRPQSPTALREQLNKRIAAIDTAKQKQRRRFAYSALAAAVIITGVLAASYVLQRKFASNTAGRVVPAKSIAVLPFQNLSKEEENAFFADGVQDELLTDLARIADLKVISRISVMPYKTGIPRDLRAIGQQLGVATVVEGSVQRSGNRVRVNAQLVDTRSDRNLWAQTYDRDLTDVFTIEDEIAKTIANQLQAKLSPSEKTAIEQAPTSDIAAFDLYSRALTLLASTTFGAAQQQKNLQAIELLNQAVARDPSFFLAQFWLADTHDLLYFLGFDHTPARLALAEAAVQAASWLRPDAGETHLARAEHLYCGYLDYAGALAELDIARRTLPNSARIFELMGYIKRHQGKREEGLKNLERSLELDPRNFYTLEQIALSYSSLRRYAEEAAVLDRALTIKPDDVETKAFRAQVEFDWRADTRPLHRMIESIRTEHPTQIQSIADAWLRCALAEHDVRAAEAALTALGAAGENVFGGNPMMFSRTFCEGLLARMTNDETKAHAAFTAARAQQIKSVQAEPDYAPALCMLGLIDAGLGRKEEALREGQRAVELLPPTKANPDGFQMIEYFACIAAWVGEKDLACEQLARATRLSGYDTLSYGQLKLLPFWDPLRSDPRFEKIVEEARHPVELK